MERELRTVATIKIYEELGTDIRELSAILTGADDITEEEVEMLGELVGIVLYGAQDSTKQTVRALRNGLQIWAQAKEPLGLHKFKRD